MAWDLLVTGARLVTMQRGVELVDDGCVAISGDRVAWVGPVADLPDRQAVEVHDVAGRLVTPGLVDCHTHLVFGGDRVEEAAQRRAGATYEQIARAGGGILSTVRDTRAASEADLLSAAAGRLARLAADGVTTVEVKSGYGLDVETELRMLRVARALGGTTGVTVVPTLLAAHAVPPEYAGRADDYVDLVCDELLPRAVGLAAAVDAFCERIAFTPAQVERVLAAARALGLPVKLHADQLSDGGGAALAARYAALSADHLEHASAAGVRALAGAGTVAVLLPGATYVLSETARPPVGLLREAGVPMAVATDANPGTAPLLSLQLAMHLGCTLHGLTPEEALAGVTTHAARALGLAGEVGVLAPGARADLAVWDVSRPAELVYWLGARLCSTVVRAGRVSRPA